MFEDYSYGGFREDDINIRLFKVVEIENSSFIRVVLSFEINDKANREHKFQFSDNLEKVLINDYIYTKDANSIGS